MSNEPRLKRRSPPLDVLLRNVICRTASLGLFAMGLLYWVRLVGIYDGELWRFDTMPVWWRIVVPVLAVLYPVAGVGLWMMASWGTVIWVIVLMVEGIMHLGFSRLFGTDPATIGLHVFGLVLLLAIRIATAIEQRRG